MTQHGIVQGDALQRISSAGFIIGTLLSVIASVLYFGYVAADESNIPDLVNAVGERAAFAQSAELVWALSMLAVMIGTIGVYRSITASGAAWARPGFYLAAIGTILWTVGYALDVAVAAAAANWLAAPATSKDAAYGVVTALAALSRGTFPMTVVVYWLAFVFLGIGMVRSALYPRSLGWIGLILGIAGLALGLVQTFNGRESTFTLFTILFTLTMPWTFVVGVWVARKVW